MKHRDTRPNIIPLSCALQVPHLRAGRALLGIDQQTLADLSGVPLPAIQRLEASRNFVQGMSDAQGKLVAALEFAGVELIGDNSVSSFGGWGVRLRAPEPLT